METNMRRVVKAFTQSKYKWLSDKRMRAGHGMGLDRM